VTVVCSYYAECVSGMDLRVAQKEAGATQLPPGAKVRGLIDSIFGQLQQVSSATNDLASLRLNWFQKKKKKKKKKVMVAKFTQVCRHTEYVDNQEGLLEEYASLGDLWFVHLLFVPFF
jgi:hypothetical protein